MTDLAQWNGHLEVFRKVVERHVGRKLDAAVAAQAKRLFVDTVACAIAGTHAPEVRNLEAQFSAVDRGSFRLPEGKPLGIMSAAQVFAMAATWDEACEGQAYAHGRPGVPLIAALLPLAIQRNSSLGELLDALVLGYEVGSRAGAWLRVLPGMHVDGNWPALGVAAGVARFIGLSPEGVLQAMNIAGCQLGKSLYLPAKEGNTSRNTYLGHSAMLGMQAAFASASGVDAPVDVLAHYAQSNASSTTTPLPGAEVQLLLDGYLKPFAAVKHVHYGATAAAQLRTARPQLVATEGITSIALEIYEEATIYCGNRAPKTPIQAQFSLTFGVAAMLRFGDVDPSVYSEVKFHDEELRRLESLVVVTVDRAMTISKSRGATLTLVCNGMEFQTSVNTVSGDAENPLDNDAVEAKFLRYAADPPDACISKKMAMAFCEATLQLDSGKTSVTELWEIFSTDDGARDGA